MNVRDALHRSAAQLEANGVESPRLDAELILGKALGLSRLELYLDHDRPLSNGEAGAAAAMVERRSRREPLAYVVGEWGFRGLTLHCDRRALVPRPETEVVVERCLDLLAGVPSPTVLDVGTGGGAIALAIAHERPDARVTGLDRSPDALALARENADAAGVSVELVEADLAAGLPGGPYDLVVSNPPYVRRDELPGLAPEVRDWEPREAILDEGQTRTVIESARHVLRDGGKLVLETHWESAASVANVVVSSGYGSVRLSEDLAGRRRVVEGRWRA